jgi:hypothetical protein
MILKSSIFTFPSPFASPRFRPPLDEVVVLPLLPPEEDPPPLEVTDEDPLPLVDVFVGVAVDKL